MHDEEDPSVGFDDKELNRLVDYSRRDYAMKRPGLFWDAPPEYKDLEEEYVCAKLGDTLFAQGKGDIRKIRKYQHPKDSNRNFPDCLAEMDGNLIGIEVTELREGMDPWKPWSLERLDICLRSKIKVKNDKAQIHRREELVKSLHQLYVVIPTDEPGLPPDIVRSYLQQIRLPKPSHVDHAFVLVPREPADNPVIRGREHETREEKTLCKAFQIQWSEKAG